MTSTTRRDLLQLGAVAAVAVGAASLGAKSASAADTGKTYCISRHPHFDRVMAPWAIKKFVDKDAKFVFAAKIEDAPKDSIPLGFKTGELSMHDENGTCFHKTVVKYKLGGDPAIAIMDKVNKQGVEWFLHGTAIDANDRYARWSYGLLGLSDALVGQVERENKPDQTLLDQGLPLYEALYQQITFELKNPKKG